MKPRPLARILLSILLGVAALPVPAQQSEAARKQFEEFKAKAEKGDAEAQFKLGGCYRVGVGVAKAAPEAVKWYRKAAEQGHAQAQNNLGTCYYTGNGVTSDKVEAVNWYRKAAEQGDFAAQFKLGYFYAKGEGVAENDVEAYKWFSIAVHRGFPPDDEALTTLEKRMTKEQIAEGKRLAREFKPRKTPEPGGSPFVEPSKP